MRAKASSSDSSAAAWEADVFWRLVSIWKSGRLLGWTSRVRFQNQGTFHGIAKFAHIAGPAMRKQFLPRGVGEVVDIFVHRGAEQFQKMFGEQQYILAAFAHRRQMKLHDVQTMEQIFAELVGGDGQDNIPVGRGDEPDIDVQFLRAADAGVNEPSSKNRSSLA